MTPASVLPAPNSPQTSPELQPDEPVWIRYSPHGELPLSSVSSFVIHGLVIGLACLAIWSASRFLDHPTRSLPIQTVQVIPGDGDGGRKGGIGDEGPGKNGLQEDDGPRVQDPGPDMPDPDLPALPLPAGKRRSVVDDKDGKPTVQEGQSMAAFQALARQSARIRRVSEQEPKGPRGPGKDVGSKDRGPGSKDAGRPMTRQEQRMARWALIFDTENGRDYVRQLAGLGAVLVVPVKEGPGGNEYQVVKNANLLEPPARLVKEDLSKYKGIHWMDDNADSVAQVMRVLGLTQRPSHFIAFMPQKLEDKLAELEKKFAGRAEDDIEETRFKIKAVGKQYIPVVVEQTPKRR